MGVIEGGSGNASGNCYMFSGKQIHDIMTARIVVSAAAVVLCLVGIIVIFALRQYRTFVHRLVIYLMVAALLQATFGGLEVAPVHHHNGTVVAVRDGLDNFCIAIGFLAQVAEWQLLLVVSWITAYLIFLAVFKYRANTKAHEIAGLAISFAAPMAINWIPFIHNIYGLAGAWCWIRTTNKDCQNLIRLGVIYQFTLLYGPQTLLILASFVSFLVILVVVRKHLVQQDRAAEYTQGQTSPYQKAVKEAMPLILYTVLYCLIASVMVANRIFYAVTTTKGNKPYYPLWLAQAIAQPLRMVFIPLGFLLHPGTLRKMIAPLRQRFEKESDSDTAYHVPQEPSFSEVEPLIIRSRQTCQMNSDYRSLFEGSEDAAIQ